MDAISYEPIIEWMVLTKAFKLHHDDSVNIMSTSVHVIIIADFYMTLMMKSK